MKNAALQNIVITWSTTKNQDGTFTGTCYGFVSLRQSVEGRFTTKNVTLATYVRETREMAKTAVIKACRYYKQSSKAGEVVAKLTGAFPAQHVTDNTPRP